MLPPPRPPRSRRLCVAGLPDWEADDKKAFDGPGSQPAGRVDDQPGAGLGVVAGEPWTVAPGGDADSEDAEGEDSDDCVDAEDAENCEDDGDEDWEQASDASTDSEDGATEFLLLPEGESI